MQAENHQDEHIEHDSQHCDEQDVHRLTSVEPLPGVCVGTNSAVGVVLVSIESRGAEAWEAAGNIKQTHLNVESKQRAHCFLFKTLLRNRGGD